MNTDGPNFEELDKVLKGDTHCGQSEYDHFEKAEREECILVSELHDAAALGNQQEFVEFIESKLSASSSNESETLSKLINQRDSQQNTPLMYASGCNQYKFIQFMIKQYSDILDINAQNSIGDTALHRATWRNHFDATKALLSVPNINENITNKAKQKPIDLIRHRDIAMLFTTAANNGSDLDDIFVQTSDFDDSDDDGF
mmetsp:Transcript_20547/g.30520  ORF Transcript_20547/g.30520 Transcript_20547/m.30520 type:complete len:200 (+) Transcript_20547:49-648(+)